MDDNPLEWKTWLDFPRIARGSATRVHLVAEVVAPARPPALDRPPIAMVLVLDTSGSMEGDKLRHLARSVAFIVDRLSPHDQIGVVCFSTTAQISAPLMPRSAWQPSCVDRLQANGTTNIEGGLRLAAQLFDVRAPDMRRAVVLLSDGIPNVGVSTPTGLAAVARSLRDTASISTLGYGADHSDEVLASIAESGGGAYAFIPSPEQCRVELARLVGAQADVVADRVRLSFEPGHGVEADADAHMPDFCAGDNRVATFALRLPAYTELGRVHLGRLTLHYRPAGGAPRADARDIQIEVSEHAGRVDPHAHGLRLLCDGRRAREHAARLAEQRDFDGALGVLHRALDEIRAAAAEASSPRLAELAEQLVDDAALMRQRPDETAQRAYRRDQLAVRVQYASPMLDGAWGPVPRATLVVLGDRAAAPIALRAELTFGRTTSADIQLPCERVSRLHTRIVAADGVFWVNDLGSSNGTLLNGARVQCERLREGDVIQIGDVRLLYRDG